MDGTDRVWRALALSLAVFLALVLLLTFGDQTGQTVEAAPAGAGARSSTSILTEFAIEPGGPSHCRRGAGDLQRGQRGLHQATEPLVVKRGQKLRIRYMNEGLMIHPMHLHGIPQQVVARDGYPLAEPQTMDTVLVAPGERIDVMVDATEPGGWAFRCHILTHAEGEDGMFGMVTALVVEEGGVFPADRWEVLVSECAAADEREVPPHRRVRRR